MREDLKPAERHEFSQIDPDPVSIFLASLGAIGSVASIWSVVETRLGKRRNAGARTARRRVFRASLHLEESLAELRDLTDRAAVVVRTSTDRSSRYTSESTVDKHGFRFGEVRILLDAYEYQAYVELHNEILDGVKAVNTALKEVVNEIYMCMDDWEGSPLRELVLLRERTNHVVFSYPVDGREPLRMEDVMRETHNLFNDTIRTVRELQAWLMDMKE
jgi:hypothetical protein